MLRKRSQWDYYLAGVRRTQTQGAGADPAPAGQEPQTTRRASRAGRFARAAARAAMGAARTVGGLLEFAVWLGLNAAIALAVIAAAQAAGAKLPPWLIAIANFIQGLLARAAQALGLGT